MSIGEELRIYKGILGNKENPLDVRFKLMKSFRMHKNSGRLYHGFRTDNLALAGVEEDSIINFEKVHFSINDVKINPSIFVSITDGVYFCDILDNYRVCRLVKDGSFLAEHGCCNVEKIGPKEFVKFRCNRPFK